MLELTTTNVSVLRNMTLNNNTISGASSIAATGNITTTTGNISSTSGNIQTLQGTVSGKNGSFQTLSITGTPKMAQPTDPGVYIGLDSTSAGGIEICASSLQYIDFTIPLTDYKGRILYGSGSNEFKFAVASSSVKATLNTTGLTVVGTILPSSDKRLKFHEKPIINALDIINKLEAVEYDQTYDLV